MHDATYNGGDAFVSLNSWQKDNPDPELYQWDEESSQWLGQVPVDRCERVYSVHVYAKYRGHSVLVDKVNDAGMATTLYAEWDGAWATENGFLQESKYEYYKTVPVTELLDYYEKQDDLLFTRWREENFGESAPAGAQPPGWAGERPRSGRLATVRGAEYRMLCRALGGRITLGSRAPLNPDPELFSWHEARGSWAATIPLDACTRMVEVTTRAEYVGYPCEVLDISPDGSVELRYLGEDLSKAAVDGFADAGDGKWTKTAHVFDLARYHERHVELAAPEWKALP
ncbi:hypothetical protein [Amycolatopsis nigrescens]|uniref:hypothetical protein n=1 Tax=Amycolatopsis nigrescens TaxID=381445 RepID=UPI0003646E81|nr:hypothetical protein [Amycolatopsis nigrescens]